jgi:hypothetical protein
MGVPEYTVHRASTIPSMNPAWDEPAWVGAETLEINNFRPESSNHRPRTYARLLHEPAGVHGIFQVQDRYVRAVRTQYQDEVWKDSCVEFFAQPKEGGGYFNFEFNCGGAFLCRHITNPDRSTGRIKEYVNVPVDLGRTIQVRSSLPPKTDPEIATALTWTLRFFIPFSLFESFIGSLGALAGQPWKGNFYKCAEESSHPHWAAWSAVDELNFHLPRCFGIIRFEK